MPAGVGCVVDRRGQDSARCSRGPGMVSWADPRGYRRDVDPLGWHSLVGLKQLERLSQVFEGWRQEQLHREG